jgi:cyclic pyranopterin phosphate synthase
VQIANRQLVDRYGRSFPYLRLSLTDVCNYSCDYCLPDGYQCEEKKAFLTVNEVKNIANAFSQLGTKKIRLTGGEPTIRKDFIECLQTISEVPGIEQVAVTTNGYKLQQNIESWVEAGLTHLNVSVDTLDSRLFHSLTGHNRLQEILGGIDHALTLGLKSIKLNAVLLKDVNSHQFDQYTHLLKQRNLSIRFIELMQTGDNLEYFNRYHIGSQVLKNYLFTNGWTEKIKDVSSGPAIEYFHPDYKGTFGVIAPYSKDFCDSCNRLRMSSTGDFHLCLFGSQGYSVRHLLQSSEQAEELKSTLCELLSHKRKTHFLHDNDTGVTPNLSAIGG